MFDALTVCAVVIPVALTPDIVPDPSIVIGIIHSPLVMVRCLQIPTLGTLGSLYLLGLGE
jgi:hypothetical protein